jgi:hypothetical protein
VCTAGACTLACSTGQTACGAACVNLTSDVNHCGACGAACAPRANSTARCLLSRCRWTCATGWGDCDGSTTNGCEAGLSTSTLHCGACGNACPARSNSIARCTSGACGFVCLPGYADCNAVATDGCEVNTRTSTSHCGACGNACPAGSACVSGVCSQSTRTLESFELAPWPRAPWVGSSAGTRETTCAQGGAYGVLNPNWIYRTDVSVGAPGTRYSGWFRLTGTSGRAYMGFGATSAGAWSLVVAFNTGALLFQRNEGYGYTDLTTTPVTWASGQWYRAEVEFGTARAGDGAGVHGHGQPRRDGEHHPHGLRARRHRAAHLRRRLRRHPGVAITVGKTTPQALTRCPPRLRVRAVTTPAGGWRRSGRCLSGACGLCAV